VVVPRYLIAGSMDGELVMHWTQHVASTLPAMIGRVLIHQCCLVTRWQMSAGRESVLFTVAWRTAPCVRQQLTRRYS
jgi:hypothetical protein